MKYFYSMLFKNIFAVLFLFFFFGKDVSAQNDSAIFANYTTSANRNKLYNNLITSINKNLSLALSESTEEKWQDVFWSLELLGYKTQWINSRIQYAFDSIENRSFDFKRGLLELAYTNYPKQFNKEVTALYQKYLNQKKFEWPLNI